MANEDVIKKICRKIYFHKYVIRPITWPYRAIKAIILCIRFPFLRPLDYDDKPLQVIPTSTYFTDIPKGWRKCFGIQMCKEIKRALLEDGGKEKLKRYRIDQIKEKYGELRWYDSHGNKEVDNIIAKYSEISYHTCIDCGRTAKYLTKDWILPLCEKCITDKQKEVADKFYSDVPFYGWTDGEYYEKHKNTENNELKPDEV